ncbi:MAG: MoaD/ThiS family protein [Ignisphaera sp.]
MRFLGHLKSRIGLPEVDVEIHDEEPLHNFLTRLANRVPELKSIINSRDLQNEYLILVNDVDVNVYGEIDNAVVKNEDTITIIPIAHGGSI